MTEYRITYTYSEYVEYDEDNSGADSIDPDYIYEKYIQAGSAEQAIELFEEMMGYDLTVELVDIEVPYVAGEKV